MGSPFPKLKKTESEQEQSIMKISTSRLLGKLEQVWSVEINAFGGTCFEEMSSSSLTNVISTSDVDATAFRQSAYRLFDLMEQTTCPPPKILIVFPPSNQSQSIININEIEQILSQFNLTKIDRVTLTDQVSTSFLASLFSKYGLILSPHIPQLTNIIFSQLKSAVIEIVPTFFDYDFGNIATQMGLKHFISLGGSVPDYPLPASAEDCQGDFYDCQGDGDCFFEMQKILERQCLSEFSPYSQYSTLIKDLNFEANLRKFEYTLINALTHLREACQGAWP